MSKEINYGKKIVRLYGTEWAVDLQETDELTPTIEILCNHITALYDEIDKLLADNDIKDRPIKEFKSKIYRTQQEAESYEDLSQKFEKLEESIAKEIKEKHYWKGQYSALVEEYKEK